MRTSLRWSFSAAAIAASVAVTVPAHADGPGTPNQPPPEMPPTQPLPEPQVQVVPQPQNPQVPSYGAYQRRKEKKGSRWYGWQTLIVDGSWIVGGPLLAAASPGLGGAVILIGYFAGPPIVHFAHGRVGMGFADFGIRVGAPIVLGTVGYLLLRGSDSGSDGEIAGLVGAVLGAGLGILGAIVIDASVLAWEPLDDDDDEGLNHSKRRNAKRSPLRFTPMVNMRDGGAVFGLAGTL